jgi:hypothetical protein
LPGVNYEHFHTPGITDEAAFKKESEYRFANGGWISVLHQHKHLTDCTDQPCQILTVHEHSQDCRPDCDKTTEWQPLRLDTHSK